MATDLVKSNADFFLDSFLARPASAIPKGAQWAVTFETQAKSLFDAIYPAIKLAYEYEPGGLQNWNTEKAAQIITSKDYQKDRGCMFCQAIGLPGEGHAVNPGGNIQSNAFIRSYVGGGRNDFPMIRMTFLDTHLSFVDSFLRGWALATSNFGMIARPPWEPENYRTDLECWKFGITPKGPFVLQKMKFQQVCCISVTEEEYTQAPTTSPVLREAQFVFNSYSVNTFEGNSPDILNNIDTTATFVPPEE